ncbi:MAG: hypothetical protein V4591_12035 [Bdellovibrionota bacterium]
MMSYKKIRLFLLGIVSLVGIFSFNISFASDPQFHCTCQASDPMGTTCRCPPISYKVGTLETAVLKYRCDDAVFKNTTKKQPKPTNLGSIVDCNWDLPHALNHWSCYHHNMFKGGRTIHVTVECNK